MEAFNLFKIILIMINLFAVIFISVFTIKNSFFKIGGFKRDRLTGFLNKKHFIKKLKNKIKNSDKDNVSLITLDVDNLSYYNKNHGYIKGDNVIKEIANIIKDNVKNKETVSREGGKFFVLSDEKHENLLRTAEILRRKIGDYEFYGEEKNKILTASISLVSSYGDYSSKEILSNSEQLIRLAKEEGKNIVKQLELN